MNALTVRLQRIPRGVAASLAIVLLVNVALFFCHIWGAPGQTSVMRLEAIGNTYRVSIDGTQVLPPPGPGNPSRAVLDTPSRGGITLGLQRGAPSMPNPQGIDSVIVTDPAGNELMRDEFNFFDTERWHVDMGAVEVKGGVLVSKVKGEPSEIVLNAPGWGDYIVTVTYRNGMTDGIGARTNAAGGGVRFGFSLLRDFPNYMEGYDVNGNWSGTVFGDVIHTRKTEVLRSMAAMLSGSYPLPLLALCIATLLVCLLAVLQTMMPRSMRLGLSPALRVRYGHLVSSHYVGITCRNRCSCCLRRHGSHHAGLLLPSPPSAR